MIAICLSEALTRDKSEMNGVMHLKCDCECGFIAKAGN